MPRLFFDLKTEDSGEEPGSCCFVARRHYRMVEDDCHGTILSND
jgi:hypothetical protein